jgi:hypothetical protein
MAMVFPSNPAGQSVVMVGGAGFNTNQLAYTTDGSTWISQSGLTDGTVNCVAISPSGTVVIATTESSSRIRYSTSGPPFTWTTALVVNEQLRSPPTKIIWQGYHNRFIAAGAADSVPTSVAYSSDGITWTGGVQFSGKTQPVTAMSWNGPYTIFIGGGFCYLSSNGGESWTSQPIGSVLNTATDVVPYYANEWLAVGTNTGKLALAKSGISGATWTTNTGSLVGDNLLTIAFNGKIWVYARTGSDGSTQLFSKSALSVFEGQTPVYSTKLIGAPKKVVWTGNKFYCVGTSGTISGDIRYNTLQSVDGTNWSLATSESILAIEVRDIACSPQLVTLTANNTYSRYIVNANIKFAGTLPNNDWVQIRNNSASPHIVQAANTSVSLPALSTYLSTESTNAIVYSSSGTLTAI